MGEFDASIVALRSHLEKQIGEISPRDPDWINFAKWHEVKGAVEVLVLTKRIPEMDARRYGTLYQRKISDLRQRLNRSKSRL